MNKANQQNSPQYLLAGKGIPNYKRITAIEINLEIPILLKDLNDKFSNLESKIREKISTNELLTWEEVMNPLYKINESLRWSWGAVCHLNAVSNTPELREAHSNQQPEVIRFINKIGQSKIIHQALTSLKEECAEILDETQIRILDKELISMNQRGVGLSGVDQEAFNSASEKLAELSTAFSNNVLDATKDWSLL